MTPAILSALHVVRVEFANSLSFASVQVDVACSPNAVELPHMLLDLLGISQNVGALLRVDTRDAIEKVGLEAKGDRSSRRVDDCVAGFWDVHVENGFSCDSSYVGSCANRRDQPKEKRVSHWMLDQDGGVRGLTRRLPHRTAGW